jgi:hypothetical protein
VDIGFGECGIHAPDRIQIRSASPMYGCSTLGMPTEPSGFW